MSKSCFSWFAMIPRTRTDYQLFNKKTEVANSCYRLTFVTGRNKWHNKCDAICVRFTRIALNTYIQVLQVSAGTWICTETYTPQFRKPPPHQTRQALIIKIIIDVIHARDLFSNRATQPKPPPEYHRRPPTNKPLRSFTFSWFRFELDAEIITQMSIVGNS